MFRGIKDRWARHQAQKKLAEIVEAAKAYKKAGLQTGAVQYQQLYQNATRVLEEEAKRSNRTVEELALEIPALYQLQQWANAPAKLQIPVLLYFVLIPIGIFGAGGAFGLFDASKHLVMRLFNV